MTRGRKRGHSCAETDDASKKLRRNSEIGDSEDTPGQAKWDKNSQAKLYIPHNLLQLMYQLDLSILQLLRKSMNQHEYPSLSLAFGDCEVDKFSDIVIRYESTSVHLKIDNVDNYSANCINYSSLFTKERRSTSINSYFASFVKYLLPKSAGCLQSLSKKLKYLIVYTSSSLDLTRENKMKKSRLKNFYPFKFNSLNIKESKILHDFLFTNIDSQQCFYQFSRDEAREELLSRLEFPRKWINEKILPEEIKRDIKEAFLDKLLFAVNQPSREMLHSIIKVEMKILNHPILSLAILHNC